MPRSTTRGVSAELAIRAGIAGLAAIASGCGPEGGSGVGWSEATPMPDARGEVGAALGARDSGCASPPCDVVAVIGGYGFPATKLARVDGYLPAEDRWIDLPDIPAARHHVAAAGLSDGTIVVSGGDDGALRDEVWALEPQSDAWVALQPLPEPRAAHRMLALGDRLIVIGGQGGDATFVWDEGAGWSFGAPIPQARDHLGGVVVDGEVWAIGGRDDDITARVDIYDPDDDRWRDGPPLPKPTSAAAVGVVQGFIVVISGEDYGAVDGRIVRDAWKFDLAGPDAGWTALARAPVDVHGAGDVVIDRGGKQRLLVLGGATWHAQWSTLSWTDRVQVLHDPSPEGP